MVEKQGPNELFSITDKNGVEASIESPLPIGFTGCAADLATFFVLGDGLAEGDLGKITIGTLGLVYLRGIAVRENRRFRKHQEAVQRAQAINSQAR